VVWAGEWPEDPGDEAILATALAHGRILVTLDKDFGELAIVRDASHAGIVRIVGFAARDWYSAREHHSLLVTGCGHSLAAREWYATSCPILAGLCL
jgi:hypothetical protein